MWWNCVECSWNMSLCLCLCRSSWCTLRPQDLVEAAQQTWSDFLAVYPSKIAAGEGIFSAIFDAAPSLQAMFKSPKATTAERFVKGFGEVIKNAGSKSKMMNSIQIMGFRHLEFDINVQKVACASCLVKSLMWV